MISQQHFKTLLLDSYDGTFKDSNNKIKCYTKKQVTSLYAKNEYKILGEYSSKNSLNSKDCIGYISINENSLPLYKYKKLSRFIYSEAGYIQCDSSDISFVVLLKNKLFMRIAITLILILLFLSGFFMFSNKTNSDNPIKIDDNIIDWFPSDNTSEPPPSSGVRIFGFGSLTIPSNTKDIAISLGNSSENSCYFKISIYLEDNTELFYSDLIPPGKGFNKITLNKALEPGEYNAIIKYETFNIDTGEATNAAKLKFILKVQ